MESLPDEVQRRINALKNLNLQHVELEAQFKAEAAELEKKYLKLYSPLYDKVQEIFFTSEGETGRHHSSHYYIPVISQNQKHWHSVQRAQIVAGKYEPNDEECEYESEEEEEREGEGNEEEYDDMDVGEQVRAGQSVRGVWLV